ncbi:MAG: peptide chain release factor N(5)-glutamine methyltransferase [Microcystis aeruginosa Ma_QC_Ch_20071001_S25]|uniref:Release factor glutamine methyltransferase n=1 Tax=Microcystis aeruginosa Ma_QC_Ch_20071001_S25D TaxID=2486250 RepID=A0A552G5N3_MICAE|nr:peptide chain release factor N(5)-glutamine methyltransferase [Microcystis sp. M113S1]MCA2939824.1 peptide chain release factor N(5)-glutamine methyltransferase [Microcystis sp. M113S1]TRU50029.1 MAG: peptide chain release factor N(5)-glutamine methyltransferase [Microcystis aeruginosa Ma_QC_Ch_20071001_S25]TRU54261.1 MAG: peptide chain release factor N(5)-glutamine methyltransferase [Microcystis aeruginosa Ma_QC_Ch_20071001_S25D]TRU61883.1 MAG: peptide chain release factor N(5)-glutamine me
MSASISGQELSQWRQQAIADLQQAQLSPKEVDIFLQAVTDIDTLSLRLQSFREREKIPLSYSWSEITKRWQKRLQARVPLQYLLESVVWRNFTLKVSPEVLIPRPETELLIDIVAETVRGEEGGIWVDLGTGSGAIAIGLASILTKAEIYASDYSQTALAIAKENIINTGFADRIILKQGSWWTPLEKWKGQISGMVSNPPYIPSAEILDLQIEVREHEPRLALDGGEDGLTALRYLAATAPDYLRSGGLWLVEMRAGQGEKVAQMLENQGNYRQIQIINDLAGFDRFVLAERI